MKRLWKRTLALMLAVLMVAGTLPTSAWAARITEDVKGETPVLDENDPVVDTMGWVDKGELPVDPVDPDPGPADPSWEEWTIQVTTLSTSSASSDFKIQVNANGAGATGSASSGNTSIALVPNLKATGFSKVVTDMINKEITTDTVGTDAESGKPNMTVAITGFTGLPESTFWVSLESFTMPADGKYIIEGSMAGYDTVADALATAGATYKDGTAWSKGDPIPMVAILVTKEGTVGITIDDKPKLGGGVGDAIWVINLGTDTIQKMNGNVLEYVDGADWTDSVLGGGTFAIPIPNTGTEKVSFAFTDRYPSSASHTGLSSLSVDSSSEEMSIDGNTTGTITMKLSDDTVGTAMISIPHYTATGNTEDPWALKGTATIMVIVISGEYMAEEVEFTIGADRFKSGDPISKEISIRDFDLNCLFDSSVDGSAAAPADTELGLSLVPAEAFTPDEYGDCADYGDISMIYGTLTETQEDGTKVEHSGTAVVTLTPANVTKDETEYSAGYTYRTVIELTNAYSDDQSFYSVSIPVKIVVEPAEGPEEYTYTLVYDGNGHTGGAEPTQTPHNGPETSYEFTAVGNTGSLVKTGYTFLGWADDRNATTAQYTAGSKITGVRNGTKTVYAVWEQDTSTVKFELDGGAWPTTPNAKASQTGPVGTKVQDPGTPTKDKHTFAGWRKTDASSDTAIADIAFPAKNTTDTYTAQWSRDQSSITFHYNGGTDGDDKTADQTFSGNTGEDLMAGKIPSGMTKDGYNFAGWFSVDAATGGTEYTVANLPKFPATKGETLHIYARWVEQGKMKFLPNNGTWKNNKNDTDFQFSGDVGAACPTVPDEDDVARTGYTFGGWAAAADSTDAVTTFTFKTGTWGTTEAPWGSATAYYAIWIADPYTITYNANWGSNDGAAPTAPDPTTGSIGDGGKAIKSMNDSGHYTFSGWNTAADGSGTNYTAGTTHEGDLTLYAKWTPKTYTVTYNVNGGTGTYTAGSFTYGSNYTVNSTAPTRTHYVFKGWRASGGISGTFAAGGTLTKPTDNVTLTAQWQGQSTVTFDENGGVWQSGDKTQTGDIGTDVNMPEEPTRMGYDFTGWSTSSTGTGSKAQIKFPATAGDTETYYAIWTPKNYTITWDGNGGKWADNDTTKTESWAFDSVIPSYAAPTRTYYDFNGWYTEAECTNKVTFDGDGPKVTGDVTYYAGWTQKTSNVTVTFHVDGEVKNPGRAVVVGFNGATQTVATTATSVTFSNVPQQAAVYPITVEGAAYGNVTVGDATNGSTVNYTVDFATAEVVTDGHGDASVEAKYGSMTSALTAATDYANSTPVKSNSIVVLRGQTATWKDGAAETNYSFKSWDSNTGNDKANKTATMAAAKVTHTAYFIKDRFDTSLVINVNTANWPTKGTSDTNIKEVQLVNGATATDSVTGVTVTRAHDRWEANGVSSTTVTAPYWRITTKDGGVYYEAATPDGSATKDFFVVKVVATKPTGCLTATVKGVSASSTAGARVVTTVGSVTAAETHSTGYTLAAWKQTANPAVGKVTISGGTVTLASDYTNAADLEVTPTYTFSTTIETRHLTDAGTLTTVTKVELKEGANTVTAVKQSADGTYLASGLDPAKTYDIWVNDFKVNAGNKQVTSANANGTVPVVVFKVTTSRDPSAGGTSNVGLNAAGNTNLAIVPNGAAVTADAPTVNAAATVATGYRKRSVANDGTGNTFWTASAGTVTTPEGGTGNATTWTIASMTADVTLTAHYVRQYDATVSVDSASAGKAEFTAKGSAGTVIDSGKTTATVDSGDYVEAQYTPSVGYALKSWSFKGGELYTNSNKSGQLTGTADASGVTTVTSTATTVYFFPTADGATLRANTEAAKYTVEVAINLDNAPYADADSHTVQVMLKDGSKVYTLSKKPSTTGVYTAKVLPGNYDIYVNGLDISQNVATTAAFDADKNLQFTAHQAEGKDPTNDSNLSAADAAAAKAKLKQEINYYTVVLKATPPTATDTTVGGHVAFANSASATTGVASVSKIFLAHETEATDDTFNIASEPTDAADAHFRFDAWSKAPAAVGAIANTASKNTTYTLPVESALKTKTNGTHFDIDSDNQITLTASFVKQYRVKVEAAQTAYFVKVKKADNATAWNGAGITDTVLVDAGDPVAIYGNNSHADWVLSDWTIKLDTDGTTALGAGEFDNAAHSVAAAKTDKTKGYLWGEGADGKFTPTKDTTLVLNAWKRPNLRAEWIYDVGTGKGTLPAPPNDRQATWTVNTTPASDTKVTAVKIVDQAGGTTVDETLDATANHYTVSGNIYTVSDTYLKGKVTAGTLHVNTNYYLQLTYQLGADDHPNKQVGLTKESTIRLVSGKYTLRQVDIQVSTDTTATSLNEHADAKDQAIYLLHKDKNPDNNISTDLTTSQIPKADLEFTWYYAPTAPAASSATKIYTDAQITAVTNAATKLDDALAANAPDSITRGTLNVDAATLDASLAKTLQGKYVFAVVKVKDTSVTGQGIVITNAIRVDYDATITLKKDTNLVADTDAGNYKVYLVPDDVANPNFAANLAAQGIVAATHVVGTDGNGVYTTKSSALDAAKSYFVYVNDAEDGTEANHHYVKADSTLITAAAQTKTVQYYSVNLKTVTQIDNFTSSNGKDVGETFNTTNPAPSFTAAVTGTTRNVGNGKGVLTGTAVTATSTTWTQDYTLTWQTSTNNDALADTASTQASGATAATYSYGAVTAKANIGGRLEQNTYTIVGNVVDVDGKTYAQGGGQIATATLTVGEGADAATYNGTVQPLGGHNKTVSFKVPRAEAGTYVLTATPQDGTVNNTRKSTLKGYKAPSDTTAPTTPNTSVALGALTAGTSGDALKDRFTIFVAATTLSMKVADDDATDHCEVMASGTGEATKVHTEKVVYANYDEITKTITVTNQGNTELKVAMTVSAGTTDVFKSGVTPSVSGEVKVMKDGVLQATIGGLTDLTDNTFTLAVGASKSFTLTIPNDLNAADDQIYHFVFNSADGRNNDQGPILKYDFDLKVEPVTIGRVTTTLNTTTNTYSVAKHWLEEDAIRQGADDTTLNTYYSSDTNSAEDLKAASEETSMEKLVQQGVSGADETNSDIIYRWYVADCSNPLHVTLDKTTGALTVTAAGSGHSHRIDEVDADAGSGGRSFTPKPEHYGKSLYLVAVGQRNAQNAVMTPDETRFQEKPVPIPFQGTIQIFHDGTLVTDETTLNKYTVELRDAADGTKFPANVVATTADPTKFVHKTAVQLEQGHSYQVWASAVEGNSTTLVDTGKVITVGDDDADVHYYVVDVAETTVDQSDYQAGDRLGIGAENDTTLFYANKNRSKPKATGSNTGTDDVTGKHVIKGTTVTFTYDKWDKDYDLIWTGPLSKKDTAASVQAGAGKNATQTLLYDATKAQVKTQLKLNLYNVEAKVVGAMGSIAYATMTLKDTVTDTGAEKTYVFTTKTGEPDANAILGVATSFNSGITVNHSGIFRLPKAVNTYLTKAVKTDTSINFVGYDYNGTNYPYDATQAPSATNHETINVTVSGNTEYAMNLQGDGLALQIRDKVDALTKPINTPAKPGNVAGAASITNAVAGTSSNAVQTIRLNYNYNADMDIVITARNNSKQGTQEGDAEQVLKNVSFTETSNNKSSHLVLKENKFDPAKNLGRGTLTGGSYPGEQDTVTLTIKAGLDVGAYAYVGTFTFTDGAVSTSVTYTLNVIVEPLTFTGVTIQDKAGVTDGTLTIDQYVATRKAEGTETGPVALTATSPAATSSQADANTALVKDSDYGYQWISTASGVTTPNIASVSASGTLTSSGTANYKLLGTGRDYTPQPTDEGRNLFLVIYGKDDAAGARHNATSFAVSAAKVNTYSGIVYIKVDGTVKSGTSDGTGYTVKFINLDTPAGTTPTPISTTWKDLGGGVYAYVADLAPNTNGYKVQVSRAKGDTNLIDLADTITGVNIGTALDHDPAYTNVTVANYFTVTAKPFNDVPYQTGTGETFTSDITPALSLGGATLASATPVLSGQSVNASVPGGWTQDYNLLWQSSKTGTDFDQTWAKKDVTGKQTSDDAKSATAYTQTITDTTFIGGRLDQNTYTVVGSISGTGAVNTVTLTGGTGNKVYAPTGDTITAQITANNTWTDADNDGAHNQGDTVTFTVVKGDYTVTGYEQTGTTIRKVTVNGTDPAAGTARNVNSIPGVDEDTNKFVLVLEVAGAKLGIRDTLPADETYHVSDMELIAYDVNKQVYYFNGITAANGTFNIQLNNPGNVDLALKAPEVYKVAAAADYSTAAKLEALLTAGTKQTVTGGSYTDANIITIANLPAASTALAINAADVAGGKVTVATNAANTADGVYVVKFASQYTEQVGNTASTKNGPTVYYVFDLTVKPLPIKQVDVEPVTGSAALRLQGYDSADATNKTGLDHVWVDDDADTTNPLATAKGKTLTTATDVAFAWVKAPTGKTKTEVEMALSLDSSNNLTSSDPDVVLETGTGHDTQQFTPADADQGKNFYLVAYQKSATANASDFAVSDALYAQVTVRMKTLRTGDNSLLDVSNMKITGHLDGVTPDPTSNDRTFTVSGADTDLGFTAAMTNDVSTPHDPSKADYYFIEWKWLPDGKTAYADAVDTGITVGADRLAMTYAVTEKGTVVGYYDKLPSLAGSSTGYDTDAKAYNSGFNTTAEKAARTLVYDPWDGSGNVQIWIEPASAADQFKGGTDKTSPRQITSLALAEAPGTMGAKGKYVLDKTWLTGNLEAGSNYIITFYDMEKGTKAGGYAGYDRATPYNVMDGEKTVIAQVNTTTPWGKVKLTNNNPTPESAGPDPTSVTLVTYGGAVNLFALPNDGYVFAGWTKVDPAKGTIADDTKEETVYSGVKSASETVVATFAKGVLTMEDQTAKVIYGNQMWEGTPPAMSATSTGKNETFTYAFLDAAGRTAAGITDGDATDAPTWLTLNADGTFAFNAPVNTNVESSDPNTYTAVTNELVVYVKATADKTGESTIKKVTIDVEPGELTIHDAAFAVPAGALGGQSVDLTQFTYTSVTDQASTNVVIAPMNVTGDHTEKGKWSVTPKSYVGNDRNNALETSEYTFTFTYGPAADTAGAEKWNYEPTQVKLSFHVNKPPQTIYIADQISNGAAVVAGTTYETAADDTTMTGKNSDVPVDLKYATATKRLGETITYLDAEPTYTVKIKGEGNLYGMSLTKAELAGFGYATGAAPTVKATWADGDTLNFDLKLTAMTGKVWVGEHTAKFEVTGYSEADQANWTDATKITATYELTVKVLPRAITKLDVTVTDDGTTPEVVKPTLEGNKPLDTEGKDAKGNDPIQDVTVTWSPEPGPDGKHTQVDVDVEIDPNYVYQEDDPTTDPEDEDIIKNTGVTVKEIVPGSDTPNNRPTPKPDVVRDETDEDHIVHISQPIPYLMHDDAKVGSDPADTTGPKVHDNRAISVMQGAKDLGQYTVNLGAYGSDVFNVEWKITQDELTAAAEDGKGIGAVLRDAAGEALTWNEATGTISVAGPKASFVLDLSAADTSKPKTYRLTLQAEGKAINDPSSDAVILSSYTFQITIRAAGGGPAPEPCPCKVFYYVGSHGITADPTVEDVSEKNRPSKVPAVTPLEGYVLRGWSLTNPATLKSGEKLELVDPKTVEAKGEAMTFYAVIVELPVHEHYVVGYPNGNFGPADDINRASVATIIARAILPDFEEGANYGNPGQYSDVSGHWAESAIAYCSQFGVFKGYTDGTFRPDQPISRQEFATVIARLDGVMTPGEMSFTDIDEAGSWALGGIYTAYAKGWVNGYTDGTFKPLNNIRRDEAVKIFNAYLGRGVDAEGLSDLTEYVHSDGATGNGENEYMTWPDVPKDHWAYYEIVEAANDHQFLPDFDSELGHALPETWEKCWIDQRWRRSGAGAASGLNAALASAAFGVGLH